MHDISGRAAGARPEKMKRCLQHYVMAAALLGTAAAAAAQPAPAAAEATERFEIRRFVVAGNTLLTEDQVQAAVAGH